jgi:LysM repeat protein
MNNPNPFVPKGSILEQQSKRRSRLKLAVFCILAVSVAGLAAMLIQGCKRTPSGDGTDGTTPTIDTNTPAMTDTNAPAIETNPPAYVPPAMTNPPVIIAPPVVPAAGEYTVVKGDILETIAKKNGVTVKALEAANPGVVPTKLKIGEKLTIPTGGSGASSAVDSTGVSAGGEVYVVKSGDTLTHIAHSHGTTVKAIESENNLSTSKIKVGQKLKIPAKAEVAAPVVAAPEPAPVTTPPVTTPSTTSTN